MPTDKKKNTGLATIRFDIRSMATIARFYTSRDLNLRNKSDILNQIIHDLEEVLVDNNLAERFEKTDEANLFLSNIGMNFRHKSTEAQYLKQLSLESLALEESSPDDLPNVDKIRQAIKGKA